MIRVLYVDDEPTFLELCKVFLERSGDFTITIATSAPEAIRILGQERFDTIVSDYQMPEMNGIEFLKHLKAEGNTMPFIIFTGKGSEEVVIEALNAGADGYLQKDGEPKSQFAELSHKIKKAVEGRQAENELRKNEACFRGYFNMPLHGIAITSPDKGWLEVNDQICSMLGYTRDELFHKNWAELTHPDDLAADVEQFNRVLSGQIEQYAMDKRFIRKDGGVIWTNITVGCILKSDGNVDYIIGLMEDINERKQIEEALRESESQFRALSENSQDYIMRYDQEHRHIYANPACLRIAGMTAEQFIGRTHRELGFPADLCTLWESAIDRVFADGQPYGETFAWTGIDGKVILDWRLFAEKNAGGKVVSVLGVSRDITKRKLAEDTIKSALAEKEVLLQEIHHRVKNNLTGIISLIDLQIGSVSDPVTITLLKDLETRIRSMALVHESLYRTEDLTHISFTNYTENLTRYLFQAYGTGTDIRCRIEMGDVPMPIETAIPCGLVMSEIVTNSLKYAFPRTFSCEEIRGESCTITLTLHREGSDYLLKIADNGTGIPEGTDVTTSHSLGLFLIRFIIKHQLRGSLEVSTEGGTAYTIRFPAPEVKERNNDE